MFSWKFWASRIPDKISFGKGAVYPIYWSDHLEDGQLCGVTYYDPKQVIIDKNLSDKQKVVTYVHEILHIISYEYGVGLTESQILKMEQAIYYLLKGMFKK